MWKKWRKREKEKIEIVEDEDVYKRQAHIKEFFDGAYKESDVDLTTDTSEGSSNLTVINKVGKKLPVTCLLYTSRCV